MASNTTLQGDPPEPAPMAVRPRDGGWSGGVVGALGVVAVASLLGVTVIGRMVRAPPAVIAAAVVFLPYLYAGVSALMFVAWAALPDRRSLPASLAVTVITGAFLWGPSWSARGAEEQQGEPVRVMSWNLRRLWGGPEDGGDPLACTVSAVREQAPDVLTLLEVSSEDVERLEAVLEMSCAHHPYLSTSGPAHGGLATCVRGEQWRLRSGSGQRFVDDEDWYYVFAEVERSDRVFNLLAVHLYPYEYVAKRQRTRASGLAAAVKGQSDQSAALLDRVARLADPTVVAGDFNSTRDASLHAALRAHLTDAWEQGGQGFGGTVTLLGLPLRIDYIYASDELAVRGAEVPASGCSDHLPVVADLVLKP